MAECSVTNRVLRGVACEAARPSGNMAVTNEPRSARRNVRLCWWAICPNAISKEAASVARFLGSLSRVCRMSCSSSGGTFNSCGSSGTVAARMRSRVEMSEEPANSRSPVIISYSRMPTL